MAMDEAASAATAKTPNTDLRMELSSFSLRPLTETGTRSRTCAISRFFEMPVSTGGIRRATYQNRNHGDSLLRPRRKRPRRNTADKRYELAPPHVHPRVQETAS
jgi:hypothetical protein